jgi:uncharacterized tellurite resistance protein B-like protein
LPALPVWQVCGFVVLRQSFIHPKVDFQQTTNYKQIMIKYLKQILSQPVQADELDEEKKLQVATCVLLIEMAGSDSEFSDDERKKIITVMQNTFELEEEYVNELIELSEEEIKESISLYEFTPTINQNFTREEKFELIKSLWRLIYTDETLNMHEDHLIKKIGRMLNLEHSDIIAAKMIVKGEKKE